MRLNELSDRSGATKPRKRLGASRACTDWPLGVRAHRKYRQQHKGQDQHVGDEP